MTNHIVQENQKAGVAKSYWDVPHSDQIEGFTTDFSVNAGQAIDFKININSATAGDNYQVEIFRLGYYGGDGATLVTSFDNTNGTFQPDPLYDASRGLVDAGNWSVTDSWSVPTDAVSGVYLARLQRLDDNGNPIGGAVNQVPFVVRNDGAPADIVLQTSDTTWHAYNGWFGNNGQVGANFYGDASGTVNHPDVQDPGIGAQDRAYALSYNRPFITRDGTSPASGAHDYLFGADYAAIYWLEQNGYDVTYISGIDTDRLGTSWFEDGQGNNIRDAYISVGHDEYWSGQQRANVEAARDAGVNLLFWSGNEVYWRTRYEESLDASATDYRTLVSYKETWANGDSQASAAEYANIDPSDEWTGTWRDLRFVDAVDGSGNNTAVGAEPENSLTGQIFAPDGTLEFGGALDVPTEFAELRYWRDTTVQSGNGTLDISPGLLGYEWNVVLDDEFRPDGLIKISETIFPWSGIVIDQGNKEFPGTATHNLTLYRAESGALVFGSGTTFWTWGLSDEHDSSPYGANIEDLRLQQFTVNLFADMGIQPASIQAGLTAATASTDSVAATASITTILPQQIEALGNITISGTATDDDGNGATDDGEVALVEISFDGGQSWRPVEGTTNWTYDWIPTPGNYDILTRAIDDSLNLPDVSGTPVQSVSVQVDQRHTLFDPSANPYRAITNDNASVELGVQFTADEDGAIIGLRYFRSWFDASDTDARVGTLWDANGVSLGTVTFNSTPGEIGWQTASFATPIDITAGNLYVASYHTNDNYVSSTGFFGSAYTGAFGTLSTPSAAGVFAYGTGSIFPSESFLNENYWIDPVFDAAIGGLTDSDATVDSSTENAVVGSTIGVTAFSPDTSPVYSLTSNPGNLFSIDANTGIVTVVGVIDREAIGATTSFEVTATSIEGVRRAVFDVTIIDVDEFDVSTPLDDDATENTVAKLASIGSIVGVTALASDGDATTNAVTYTLVNNTNGYFAIDGNSGVVTVASDLSAAAATEQITVQATSADGSVASATFDISVTDTPQVISLFDTAQAPVGQLTNDGSSLELGVQFQSSQSGTIEQPPSSGPL